MAKIRPVNDNVLVRRDDPDEKSSKGIVLPEVSRERRQRGEVLAVGPGKYTRSGKFVKADVKLGDVVLYLPGAGQEFDYENEKFILLNSDEIQAAIDE